MRQNDVYICDYLRTPKGKFGGSLSSIRTDDLAALPRKQLMLRYPNLEWEALGDLVYGCANQAGEGNRSVERMALLLAECQVLSLVRSPSVVGPILSLIQMNILAFPVPKSLPVCLPRSV